MALTSVELGDPPTNSVHFCQGKSAPFLGILPLFPTKTESTNAGGLLGLPRDQMPQMNPFYIAHGSLFARLCCFEYDMATNIILKHGLIEALQVKYRC